MKDFEKLKKDELVSLLKDVSKNFDTLTKKAIDETDICENGMADINVVRKLLNLPEISAHEQEFNISFSAGYPEFDSDDVDIYIRGKKVDNSDYDFDWR